MKEQNLFSEEEFKVFERKKVGTGGSGNPLVFHDYESFIAKFTENPKTTDECWTPRDVYDAVVQYVSEIYDMTDKVILRPFYPGGDYEHAEYPENGVVIDNPPFSMFTKICKFYVDMKIPFFLFGPGLTIMSIAKYCTAVFVKEQITFDNGAKVRCNFASNLYGDLICTTAIRLGQLLDKCPSQNQKVNLPTYVYPEELLSASDMQIIAKGKEDFAVHRSEAHVVRALDNGTKKGLFGDHLLLAAAKAAAKAAIHISLSDREQGIVSRLNGERRV